MAIVDLDRYRKRPERDRDMDDQAMAYVVAIICKQGAEPAIALLADLMERGLPACVAARSLCMSACGFIGALEGVEPHLGTEGEDEGSIEMRRGQFMSESWMAVARRQDWIGLQSMVTEADKVSPDVIPLALCFIVTTIEACAGFDPERDQVDP